MNLTGGTICNLISHEIRRETRMKLYVWGTGVILGRIMGYRIREEDVIAFIDNDRSTTEYMGKPVISPDKVKGNYDAIIVANSYAPEIYKQCRQLENIDSDKMIYLYNNYLITDLNRDYKFISEIFDEKYADIIKDKYHMIRSVACDEVKQSGLEPFRSDKMYQEDYVRVRTLKLAAEEIKRHNIQGSVAEVGVFQGNFAKYLNDVLPERKCYLFDTFEGFVEDESKAEKEQGNVNEYFINPVKNTSIEMVMSKMRHKETVIVKKGKFPDSLDGLEDAFSLVSLDVDFEESTLAGLEYFYPRLSVGGYIFIHDYNYGYYDSVMKAVDIYEKNSNTVLPKVPICDSNGTLVITKGK